MAELILTIPKALAQTLERLTSALKAAQNDRAAAQGDCRTYTERLNNLRPLLENAKRGYQAALMAAEHSRTIFEEELCRGPGQPAHGEGDLLTQAAAAEKAIRQNDRSLTHESLRDSLTKNVNDCAGDLSAYRITRVPLFESEEGVLRNRIAIQLTLSGQQMDLLPFIQAIESQIAADQQLLSEEDRRLFETILNQTVISQLRNRIDDADEWVRQMSEIMGGLNTSMGLRFSLQWKGNPATQPEELATQELVSLLRRDPDILSDADRERISRHFRAKVANARELSRREDVLSSYADLVRTALDFRNWFAFHLFYEKRGDRKKELTNAAFNSMSGGEKAMAMYVPLFAALSSQYKKAEPDSPRLLALDEAFAGVDEKNIESMFALVHTLHFGYIMNSQALWGCYPSVDSLEIAELWRPQNANMVTILLYRWNGRVKEWDSQNGL